MVKGLMTLALSTLLVMPSCTSVSLTGEKEKDLAESMMDLYKEYKDSE